TSFARGKPFGSCFTKAARYSSTRLVRHARSHSDPAAEAAGAWAFAVRVPMPARTIATTTASTGSLLCMLGPLSYENGADNTTKGRPIKTDGSFRPPWLYQSRRGCHLVLDTLGNLLLRCKPDDEKVATVPAAPARPAGPRLFPL